MLSDYHDWDLDLACLCVDGLASVTHCGDLRFLQGQPVSLPHVRVYLKYKHGDHALGSHNDHVRICYRTMYYGRAQIHRNEVELFH